jgi:HK97 family phage portal protein
MSLFDGLRSFFALDPLQQRTVMGPDAMPTLDEQLAAMVARHSAARPWRPSSINEALGVPAIFRAVSLISNTTGRLALDAFRNGSKMADADIPRIVKRPDPFRTPREFYRDTAYHIASRGESWWWIGARDIDDSPLSLIVAPPWEVTVQPNDRDRLRPTIYWLDKEIPRRDMVHLTFLPDDTGYRGVGPLQMCGAAISVAVEAQEWAANFYAGGGYPSILVQSNVEMTEAEATALKNQWMSGSTNVPKIVSPSIADVKELGANVESAQMLNARDYQNGDACRLYGIPGALMEYAHSGTSLTYQNVESVWREFQEGCLTPNYLEPIEQAMSDLLPRTTVARFNVEALLRADIKTRYDVYNLGIPLGVLNSEEARQKEGLAPGDVEFAPIPFSSPGAIPANLPIQSRSAIRCNCGRLLGDPVTAPYSIRCPRCKAMNVA